jgi:hypothetical protein
MADAKLLRLMHEDLKRSGLTPKDAKSLSLKPLDAQALQALAGFQTGPGYEIPYQDFQGSLIEFSRFKLFFPTSFKGREVRYWQPSKSLPHIYLPGLVNWKKVLEDPELEVWITEGEKKAAALCAQGVPCVAVSGVWAWTSKKQHQQILPELKALVPRSFVLCFDSDADDNPNIKGALSALAVELERLGGIVRFCKLPALKRGSKTGLDDFLVHHRKNGLAKLVEIPKEQMGLSAAMQALNNEVFYVEEQQLLFNLAVYKFCNPQQLTSVVMSNRRVTTYDRVGNPKEVNVAAEWLKWPHRKVVPSLTYAPGQPAHLPDGSYNLWKGWPVEPRKGDTMLFEELLTYLSQDLTDEQRTWWLQWMAYPLQHPGTKLFTACVVYSHFQGTGKTLLGYTLGRIYGENYVEATQENLHSSFNDWARCKQFIVGDEITGSDKRSDADRLKHMITRARVIINQKYQPAYELPDVCNYYLTTNQPDSLYVEATDRRFFVVETKQKPLSKTFYKAYDKFYKSEAGIAAIFQRLLDVDTHDFNPAAPAPQTAAKQAMHLISGTECDGMVRELLRSPQAVLQLGGQPVSRELFTLQELQLLLDPHERIGRMQIARSLRRLGAPPPFVTGLSNGAKALYCIANFERWLKASHAERVAHYENVLVRDKKRKAKVSPPINPNDSLLQ